MGCLKSFAVGILSFLLFLSLSLFGLVLMLSQTILNPDFVVSQVNKLDVSALAEEFLSEQVGEQIPQEGEFMAEVINDTITDLEPWIKEQVGTLTYPAYDYITGKSPSLSVVISLEPVKDSLKDNLRQAVLQSPPPELAGIPQAQFEQYFDEYYQEFTTDIPDTFEFDESSFPTEVQSTIGQVRQIIDYVQLGYKALIVVMVLLILCIILINWNVKRTTRSLGTTSLTYGILGYAGVFAAKYLSGTQLAQFDVPPSLQAWLPQFIADLLSPWEMFSIGLAVAGVVLIIVSFVYKQQAAAQASSEG